LIYGGVRRLRKCSYTGCIGRLGLGAAISSVRSGFL